MLDYFQQLGKRLTADFKAAGHDYARFPAIAEAVLQEVQLPTLNYASLAGCMTQPGLPKQRLDDRFSDLPVVLFHDTHFRIDLLCWLHATTSIHQHAFSGAFRVWQGSSVHTRYRFIEQHQHSRALRFGEVVFEGCELLSQGAVRTIHAGSGLTHSVFHLDAPTYSLVVRTHSEPWNGPQLTLMPPAVAYAPDLLRQQLEPVRQLVSTMQELGEDELMAEMIRRLPQLDTAVVAVYGGWWTQLARREGLEREFMQAVAEHHGSTLAAALPAAALRHAMDRQGHHLRGCLQDRDLRYFIAVLMNTTRRDVLEHMIRDRDPQTTVAEFIQRSVLSLLTSGEMQVTLQGTPAADVVDVLLKARNEQAFLAQLSIQNPQLVQELSLDGVFGLYRRIRSIPIFTAIFS